MVCKPQLVAHSERWLVEVKVDEHVLPEEEVDLHQVQLVKRVLDSRI